jgi:hypothetical protein
MALPMEDTAYISTYHENGDGERRDNLVAMLRWRHAPTAAMRDRANSG